MGFSRKPKGKTTHHHYKSDEESHIKTTSQNLRKFLGVTNGVGDQCGVNLGARFN